MTLLVASAGFVWSCGDNEADRSIESGVGQQCDTADDCPGALTCRADFPGGACVTDCNDGCPDESACGAVDGTPVCLATCSTASDCRDGYACNDGLCEPADNPPMMDAGPDMPDAAPRMPDAGSRDSGDQMRDTGTSDTEADTRFDTGDDSCEETLGGQLATRTLESNCTYTVEETLEIPNSATVTVQAGATIEMSGLYSLIVDGRLDVRGTSDNPVSLRATSAEPRAGDWGNIIVGEAGTLRLNGAEVAHFSGIAGFGGAIEITSSELTQVRPSNTSQFDVDIDAVVHLKQDTTGELRETRVAQVTGPDPLGVISFDADGVKIVDSVFEQVEGTVFSINGFDSTIGATIEHNRVRDSGGIAITSVQSTTFEYNDLQGNGAGIWVTRDDFRSVSHSLAHNNFDNDGDYEISAEGQVDIDATDSYWGGSEPADRTQTSQGAEIDTANARQQTVDQAGPRN
jgi:hypothetical protein